MHAVADWKQKMTKTKMSQTSKSCKILYVPVSELMTRIWEKYHIRGTNLGFGNSDGYQVPLKKKRCGFENALYF